MSAPNLSPWEILESRPVYSASPWIEVSLQKLRLPCGKIVADYHQVAMPEYTMIFAETDAAEVLLIRQYKHGMREAVWTFPAGLLEANEAPFASAKRELLEETGYESSEWESLGASVPNANYGCGKAHFFHARGCRSVALPDPGDLEEMELVLLPKTEVHRMVLNGEFKISGMIALAALVLLKD